MHKAVGPQPPRKWTQVLPWGAPSPLSTGAQRAGRKDRGCRAERRPLARPPHQKDLCASRCCRPAGTASAGTCGTRGVRRGDAQVVGVM